MISIIVAVSENNVIGREGGLPWRLSDDLRRFKAITMSKPVVMGRKTWESIGRPLPGRHNIVITRQPGFEAQGCQVVGSRDEAVAAAEGAAEVMIIGGSEIYALFLPEAGRIYLTRVHTEIEGDAFFGELGEEWTLVSDESHAADHRNEFDVSFRTYERTGRS